HTGPIWGLRALSGNRILSWQENGDIRWWSSEGEPLGEVRTNQTQKYIRDAYEFLDGRLITWGWCDLQMWSTELKPINLSPVVRVDRVSVLPDERFFSWSHKLQLWNRDGT